MGGRTLWLAVLYGCSMGQGSTVKSGIRVRLLGIEGQMMGNLGIMLRSLDFILKAPLEVSEQESNMVRYVFQKDA